MLFLPFLPFVVFVFFYTHPLLVRSFCFAFHFLAASSASEGHPYAGSLAILSGGSSEQRAARNKLLNYPELLRLVVPFTSGARVGELGEFPTQGKARRGGTRQGEARQSKTRRGKTKQRKRRRGEARQEEARQEEARRGAQIEKKHKSRTACLIVAMNTNPFFVFFILLPRSRPATSVGETCAWKPCENAFGRI